MADDVRADERLQELDVNLQHGDCDQPVIQEQKSFSVFIINSAGEMLIQKRSQKKEHCPGLWSNACSSSTLGKETAHAAALRRLQEELGLHCSLYEAFPFMYRVKIDNPWLQCYNHVFIGVCDNHPQPNSDEIEDVKWVAIQDLLHDIQERSSYYAPWFRSSIEGVALFIRHSLFNRTAHEEAQEKEVFESRVTTSTPIKVDQLANIVEKTWGHEEWIVNNAEYCGKKLVFIAGHQCSMHHHKIKNETFYALTGKMYLETRLDDQVYTRVMTAGDVAHISRGMWHQVTALENTEIIEFSTFHMDEDSYRSSTSGKVDIAAINFEAKG
ncbi:MAG: NUDIX domain-containing protein [Candidatus Babeliales bacterium]